MEAATFSTEASSAGATLEVARAYERVLVLGELIDAREPTTARALADRLRSDEPTVLRILGALELYHQVRRIRPIDGGPVLYLTEGGARVAYIRCTSCSRVISVETHPLEPLRIRLERKSGHRPRARAVPAVRRLRRLRPSRHIALAQVAHVTDFSSPRLLDSIDQRGGKYASHQGQDRRGRA